MSDENAEAPGARMLMEYLPWLFGSVPYLLLLMLGICYCVLREPQSPGVYRWTLAALSVALLACLIRPLLTHWPWLLQEQFPRWLMYHSFASAALDVAPLALLLQALRHFPEDPSRTAGEINQATTANGFLSLPRWAWLLIGGGLFLILFQTAVSLLQTGKLGDMLLALAGAAPCLLLVWWLRNRALARAGDRVWLRMTDWALVAWLLAWIARPVLLASPLSADPDEPVSAFLSALCSGGPIVLLGGAVLLAAARAAKRESPTGPGAPAGKSFLWVVLGGIVGAILSAILLPIAWAIATSDGGGGGHGAWFDGVAIVMFGIPISALIGVAIGGIVTALKLRDRLSLRRFFLIGGAVYLVVVGGIVLWKLWSSPTREAVASFPVEQQPAIALLYELRAIQPSHMKSLPPFARDRAAIQADLDALGTSAVPALIAALDDWHIHHFATEQLG